MDEKEKQERSDQLMELIAETAESVDGVRSMSSTFTEAIADNLPGGWGLGRVRGVRLEERADSLSVDIYLNAEYGKSIPELAWNVQAAVNERVREELSVRLKKINIHVQGVRRPDKRKEEQE